ncbi:hypothetical protein CRG98_010631 [Punica granatum]|uniref:Uncharacterized protein n=1 Tax=Punica granatum TaxID=22663 RepID=A0A2I0KKD2_PUNGR|nr:hypothetical protein CRG98_010631 [Punica granatum]
MPPPCPCTRPQHTLYMSLGELARRLPGQFDPLIPCIEIANKPCIYCFRSSAQHLLLSGFDLASGLGLAFTAFKLIVPDQSESLRGIGIVPVTSHKLCRTYSTLLSSWDSAPRAFPRTAAHAYPQSRKGHIGHRRRAMRKFTFPRELVLDPFLILQRGRCPVMRYPLRS